MTTATSAVKKRAAANRAADEQAAQAEAQAIEDAEDQSYIRQAKRELRAEAHTAAIEKGRKADATARLAIPFDIVVEVDRVRVDFVMNTADGTHRSLIARAVMNTMARLDKW